MPLLFIFVLFFNTLSWHWWHSQVSRLFNYVSFSKSHLELVVRSESRNSLKSLAVSSDSVSYVELFITQTKAALLAVLQLSFRKTISNLHLRVHTTSNYINYMSSWSTRVWDDWLKSDTFVEP